MSARFVFSWCIVFLFIVGNVHAAETDAHWPIFHGPRGDNKSTDTGLLAQWPEGGPKLLWTADFIGFGYSGVAISDGRIFTSGNVPDGDGTLSMVFCLDMDGKLIWKKDNGPGLNDSKRFPGTRSTPTVDGDFVYDKSAVGDIACFDVKTGRKIWTRNDVKDFDATIHRWALAESVLIDGDNLICAPVGNKAAVVALDKRTGKTVWESEPTGATNGFATPYLFEFDGLRVVAVMTDDAVLGLDPATGAIRFSHPVINSRKINATIPIYRDGFLFVTSGYGGGSRLLQLEKDGEKIKTTEVWHEKKFDNQHGGVVLVDDHVYGTTHNGSWASIAFKTGEVGYLERVIGSGSVHFADGLIYGLSENDKTVVLYKPTPERYTEISRFELPNDAEGKSWAHPVVCGGRLYLRHAQYLYCFDVSR